uniref:ATP synthase subunit a n=1 Tax=Sperchon placodermus TaxID=3136837 RepID=A0AAU6QE23_9ACAR
MTNLFSMFDPSTSSLNLNWSIIMMPTILLMTTNKTSKMKMIFESIMKFLKKEIIPMLEKSKKNSSISLLMSLFFMLAFINITSLFPYNFTIASQISMSFPLALSLWLSFMILGWMKNTKSMMAHLLPMGTPPALMSTMVLIELTSLMIRPITLAVRLTANMVAGHLLLNLLSSLTLYSIEMPILCSPALMALTFLEIAVAMIQAFVFMTLIALYSTEIN